MDLWGFITLFAFALLLVIGFPVSFSLLTASVVGTLISWGPESLYQIVSTTYSDTTSFILLAVPLFIFMANLLQRSGIADDLYEVIYKWSGGLRGGLAMGTVVICALFGAMAGISSVATVTMGLIALPAMLKRGYDKSLVLGSIMAGGALGILIPPSVIMIIYSSIAEVSIGRLFMAGILPGIIMTAIFITYILVTCIIDPSKGPPVEVKLSFVEKLKILNKIIWPILLILLVLGSIYFGVATPTEAAGVGACGALLCMAINREFTWKRVFEAALSTVKLNAMVLWIIIGAACFTHYLAVAGVQDSVQEFFLNLRVSRWWILIFTQIMFFLLGMILEPAAIITLFGPIFIPIIQHLNFDLIWFGVLFVINMTMGYITPPFGFNLFILKGVAPKEITMGDLYKSIWPFCTLQAVSLLIVIIWPDVALWLPSTMKIGG